MNVNTKRKETIHHHHHILDPAQSQQEHHINIFYDLVINDYIWNHQEAKPGKGVIVLDIEGMKLDQNQDTIEDTIELNMQKEEIEIEDVVVKNVKYVVED